MHVSDETSLPEPDPEVGAQASHDAGDVRDTIERELHNGDLDFATLADYIEAEQGHPAGHMNVRRALIALPHIDDVRADEILDELNIEGDRNLDTLGTHQWDDLEDAVAQYE